MLTTEEFGVPVHVHCNAANGALNRRILHRTRENRVDKCAQKAPDEEVLSGAKLGLKWVRRVVGEPRERNGSACSNRDV